MSASGFTREKAYKFHSQPQRKKRFTWVGSSSVPERATSAAAEQERPTPLLSASGKKLALSMPATGSSSEGGKEISELNSGNSDSCLSEAAAMQGLRMIDCQSLLVSVMKLARCADCSAPLEVREKVGLGFRSGLVTKMWLACTKCNASSIFSDLNHGKSVNAKSVLASRMVGMGCTGLDTFCRVMGLPPSLSAPAFSKYNKELARLSALEAEASFRHASAILHRSRGIADDEILEIIVSEDGSWSKRGFTAAYGIVAVLSWETGQVLDVSTLSKGCPECKAHEGWDPGSEEYRLWWEGHEDGCNCNYAGSSPMMEPEGAERIWKRSEDRLKLRYTTVVSDGDSKTIPHLNHLEVYGVNNPIIKHECVGHVQKSMGKALRELRKTPVYGWVEDVKATREARAKARRALAAWNKEQRSLQREKGKATGRGRGKTEQRSLQRGKGKATGRGRGKMVAPVAPEDVPPVAPEDVPPVMVRKQLSWTGARRMSNAVIAYLQRQYGNAIRRHKGDVAGMKDAVWAVYYHSISTDSKPDHRFCPVGVDSWCRYNRAVAMGETTPSHSPKIPEDLAVAVKPVFDRLCGEDLLGRCELGATQNQNESFNAVVWKRCPKTEYCSLPSVEIAVNLAVLTFNHGMKGLVPLYESFVGEPIGRFTAQLFADRDATRVRMAEQRTREASKEHRLHLKSLELAREERNLEAEGVSYEPGGF